MTRRFGSSALVAFLSAALLSCGREGVQPLEEPIAVRVTATPLALNPGDPGKIDLGSLRYVGGWVLTADSPFFGGFSGLDVRGGMLTMINDRGYWFHGRLTGDEKVLDSATLEPFALSDKEMARTKVDLDAEDITYTAPGGYLVSFEQNHRVSRVEDRNSPEVVLPALSGVLFDVLPNNGGIEALTLDAAGRIIAIAERGRQKGLALGWRLEAGGEPSPFFVPAPKNHAPTSAALLPDGDIILTTRRYSVVDGNSIKILRLDADTIGPGSIALVEEVAHLAPPLSVDNIEGIAVTRNTDGSTRLWLVSDDNFNSRQRTLLMVFDLAS